MSGKIVYLEVEKQSLCSQIGTLEWCIDLILKEVTANQIEIPSRLIVETMIVGMHDRLQELQTELLHNRLATAFLSQEHLNETHV